MSHLSRPNFHPVLTRVATTHSNCCCKLRWKIRGSKREACASAALMGALLCKRSSTRGQQSSSANKLGMQESNAQSWSGQASVIDRESEMHSTVWHLKYLHNDRHVGSGVSMFLNSNSHASTAY